MESNSDRSFILVIVLALLGAVVIGAIIIVSLTQSTGEDGGALSTEAADVPAAETEQPDGDASAADTEPTSEQTQGEATADAAADTTSEASAQSPAEPTAADTVAAAGEGEAETAANGAATPTSLSRVNGSILLGTQTTAEPRSQAESGGSTTGDEATGSGNSGAPTPTSLSRVPQSITLGGPAETPVPDTSGESSQQNIQPEQTPEATAEATAESTESAAAMITGGQSGAGGDDASPLRPPDAGFPGNAPSILNTQGTVSEQIGRLWWIMIILGTGIYAYVMVLLLNTVRNREPNVRAPEDSPARQRNFVAVNGFAMPIVALSTVFAFTIGTLASITGGPTELTVEVTGQQWWWEVRYPSHEVVTANEIHIPVGERVRFTLETEDVIHSFWVPELGGKMDMIPGRTNSFWLQADAPGEYRGQCAEYCGLQHANMALYIIASPRDEFDAWLQQQAAPAAQPQDELAIRGQEIFMGSGECSACHAIRGTNAAGIQGPDLTHLASRRTIGAGTIPNTRGHLGGWIVNSQGIKPGNFMPPIDIAGQDLQALLAYLSTLQ